MRSPNASTVTGEQNRRAIQKSETNAGRSLQQKQGTIIEVHPTLPMVKVEFINGQGVAGNNWLPVGHSVLDIIHRFGVLRAGLRVMVTYSGEVEKDSIVTIIGVEGEKLGAEIQQTNEIKTGVYEIFTPGLGI